MIRQDWSVWRHISQETQEMTLSTVFWDKTKQGQPYYRFLTVFSNRCCAAGSWSYTYEWSTSSSVAWAEPAAVTPQLSLPTIILTRPRELIYSGVSPFHVRADVIRVVVIPANQRDCVRSTVLKFQQRRCLQLLSGGRWLWSCSSPSILPTDAHHFCCLAHRSSYGGNAVTKINAQLVWSQAASANFWRKKLAF